MNALKYKHSNNIIIFILIIFSQIYSPVISDDWAFYNNFDFFLVDRPLASLLIIRIHQFINQDYLIDLFKIFKIIYIFANYFLLYKFFSLFVGKNTSQIFSLIAIFYPLHDSANYQIWSIVHQFCMILPLYSYYLIEKNKRKLAYIVFFLSSFLSYTALPSQCAIIINKIRNNKKNISIIFIASFLIYVFYHLFVSLYLDVGTKIIGTGITNIQLTFLEILNIKNIIIHIFSFFDILIGPSHLIKIIYPIINNSILTSFFSLLLALFFLIKQTYENKYNIKSFNEFLIIIIGIVIISQIFLIISTKFISIPFGLGNRVNIFISLFIALILLKITYRKNRFFIFLLFLVFFLTFFGNNNYWKKVNLANIKLNNEINTLSNDYKNKQFFLKNVEYVKFFNFKHVELLTFQYSLDHFIIYNQIDIKDNSFHLLKEININFYKNDNNFILYDFETKKISEINNFDELYAEYVNYNDYYKYRHWLQYFDLSKFNFILPEHYKLKFVDNLMRSQ